MLLEAISLLFYSLYIYTYVYVYTYCIYNLWPVAVSLIYGESEKLVTHGRNSQWIRLVARRRYILSAAATVANVVIAFAAYT